MLALGLLVGSGDPELDLTLLVAGLLCVGLAAVVEGIIHGLVLEKKWAWFAALILSAGYIPSTYIILGIIGLWGLLDKEVRKKYLG